MPGWTACSASSRTARPDGSWWSRTATWWGSSPHRTWPAGCAGGGHSKAALVCVDRSWLDTRWPAYFTRRWRPTAARQAAGRSTVLLVLAVMDNHGRREGGTMSRLDDTAVAEGLQRLPGWERRGNQILKTFVRKDFANAITFVNEVAEAAEAAGHQPDIDIRWNKATPGPLQPRRGWADRQRLPTRRPHPGTRPAHPARLTDRRARIEALDHQGVAILRRGRSTPPRGAMTDATSVHGPWPEVAAVGCQRGQLGQL